MWDTQDHENGMRGKGVIIECKKGNNTKWAEVTWNNGLGNMGYRIGAENRFDLYYAGNNQLFYTPRLLDTFYYF